MELVSDYEAYEQQIRLIKQLKSEGATKAKLRSAAATLAELKRRGKSRTNVKSHETIPPGQSSEDFLKIYREHFHIIPTDEDGFTVSFVLSSGDLKQDTEEEARARVFFDQFGFVVFRDVIDSSSCENSQQEIWKFLEKKHAGFQRSLPETYHNLSSQTYGLASEPAIFSTQIVRNRSNAKVLEAFRLLLEDEDILVSHDRWCVYRPTRNILFKGGHRDMKQWKTKENLHLDLNPWTYFSDAMPLEDLTYETLRDFSKEINGVTRETGPHVQGVLALNDNTLNDGGTVLIAGVHKCFHKWVGSLGPMATHIHPGSVDSGHLVWRGRGSGSYIFAPNDPLHNFKQRVTMRSGSFLIWDQRVAHGSAQNNSNNFRIAQFIKAFRRQPVGKTRLCKRAKRLNAEIERNQCFIDYRIDGSTRRALGLS